jgi:two-component system NtrC family sensor kinase
MPTDDPNVASVRIIVNQANRCRDIIRGLLDFARQREPDKALCNVNDILLESISLLERQALFHNVKITKDFDVELPVTTIDPSQIERVFLNMIVNAAEAMNGQGNLTLATRYDPLEDCIEAEISDTGHGIKAENLRYVFDPFFTTKEVGKGTGLGLAISYGITREHDGTISVKSEVGKGTTFIIRLPVDPDKTALSDEQQLQNTNH